MPSILSDDDKHLVKRVVPKPSNKIHAVAVARLYIAYPDPTRWTYTGLQGAAVLADDLVGNTMWIKLVDISVSLVHFNNCADLSGIEPWRHLGSRNLRLVHLQPRPNLFPLFRV
jgi:hypothetical protein